VVDFAGLPVGTTVILANDAAAPFPTGPTSVKRGGMPLPQIMQFTVTAGTGFTTPLPATLRATPIRPFVGQPVAATRSMDLVEIHNALGSPLMVLLNNRNFNPDGTNPANMHVKTNTLEQWEIINTTVDAHPIHLHFTQFQVLNRQKFNATPYLAAAYPGQVLLAPNTGPNPPPTVTPFLNGGPKPPAANELGWKDTVPL
jgi:spore coat protein A, manganese oxidase